MMLFRASVSFAALMYGAAFGQTPGESTPRFQVADVHSSPRTTQPVAQGPFYAGSRYELRFATMLDLIRTAYGVDPEKVVGGPSWLELDRFDVFAQAPAGSTAETRRRMLQALLADRFVLVVHHDSKPIAAFGLKAGKRPLLKETDGSGSGCNFTVENTTPPAPGGGPPQGPINLPVIVYTCKNTTMTAFADGMLSMAGAGQYFNNRLVVDQTELQGAWDFTFKFTPKIPAGVATTGESIPLFDALEKQLGLRLEAATVPMPVIAVDSANRKPTENPPDVAKSFPPLPTEFDVAEIKPAVTAPGGGRGGGPRPEIKNGRVYLPGITLKNLISVAWDINGDDMMANAPKWIDSERFDVIAKAPAGVAIGDLTPSRSVVPVNIEALRPMLRALLVERFQMKVHMEDRPVAAYTLVAAKPKLKQADPNSRSKWQEGAATDSKDKNANASLGRLVTCQNVTMAQFAELLPTIAPGYLHTQVTDATGLEGGWDFTFSFSPAGLFQLNQGRGGEGRGGEGGAAAGTVPEASLPSGALSLFDALIKQLGLKLEMQKRPTPVLVIDHVDQKPTDN
jgi:uncharacterized protein (TIGR03435 family)